LPVGEDGQVIAFSDAWYETAEGFEHVHLGCGLPEGQVELRLYGVDVVSYVDGLALNKAVRYIFLHLHNFIGPDFRGYQWPDSNEDLYGGFLAVFFREQRLIGIHMVRVVMYYGQQFNKSTLQRFCY